MIHFAYVLRGLDRKSTKFSAEIWRYGVRQKEISKYIINVTYAKFVQMLRQRETTGTKYTILCDGLVVGIVSIIIIIRCAVVAAIFALVVVVPSLNQIIFEKGVSDRFHRISFS